MPAQAYALKEPYEDDFAGGSVATRTGEMLDVGELLKKGKGYIVADDPLHVEALDGYEPLKHTTLKEARESKKAPAKKDD